MRRPGAGAAGGAPTRGRRGRGLRLAAYAALLALAQGLIRALGQPIVHPADTRVRYHSDVLHGLASAVAQRSVGEKPSPLPLLSTGASVMRRAPLAT